MLGKFRQVVAPAKEICTVVTRPLKTTTQSPQSTQVAAKHAQEKLDYYAGDQRRLTQYLINAFEQKDPEVAYHDVKRGDHDFSSCDYLALAENKQLNEIEADFVREHGRITFNRSGVYPRKTASLVNQLEEKCAEWLGASSALMTNSGTEANVNTLQLLLSGNKMPIYVDKYAHATFILGARAAGRNDAMYFKHNNVDGLLKLIKEHGPGIVCIDTVYSALGTVAPIEEIVDVCKQNNCILIADEAHAIGTFGLEGEGLVKMKGLEKDVPFRTTSLGKAFGGGGGLILFNEEAAEGRKLALHLTSMPIFSLAPQESLAVRLLAALEIIKKDNSLRQELDDKTEYFRKGVRERGYNGLYVQHSKTNILPFVVGNVEYAKSIFDMFVNHKIYPSPHFYPASPRNKSVVRFTVCNTLSYKQLDYVLDYMESIRDIVKPEDWVDNHGDVFDMGFERV